MVSFYCRSRVRYPYAIHGPTLLVTYDIFARVDSGEPEDQAKDN